MIEQRDDFEDTFEKIVIYAIQKGDQHLWDIIYPYIKSTDYKIGETFIKYFSHRLQP